MKKVILVLLLFILAGAVLYPSNVFANFQSTFELIANSNAGGETVSDYDYASQINLFNPLSVSVASFAGDYDNNVFTMASGLATWESPYEGHVEFNDVGWSTSIEGQGNANINQGADWTYKFIATYDGMFEVKYDIMTKDAGLTDNSGLGGFFFSWNGLTNVPYGEELKINSSGGFFREVVKGETYIVSIENQANILGSLGDRDAFMDANIDWVVSPEPATMLLLGGGLAGAIWRRRKIAKA